MSAPPRWESSTPAAPSRMRLALVAILVVVVTGMALRGGGDLAARSGALPGQPSGQLPVLPPPVREAAPAPSPIAPPEPAPPDPAPLETARGSWEDLAPAPVRPPATAESVWTGTELLVFGGDGEVAAFHPRQRRWRELPPYPGRVVAGEHVHGLVWTGAEVLALAKPLDAPLSGQPVHALDPTTGTWRRLPDGPVSVLPPAVAVWTGSDLIYWGRPAGPRVREGDPATGAVWSAEEGWRVLRRAPTPRIASAAGTLTTQGLVVWGRRAPVAVPAGEPDTYAARLDPRTGEWTALRAPPLADPVAAAAVWTGACGPDGQPTCERLVLWGGPAARFDGSPEAVRGASLDLRLGRWSPLPSLPVGLDAEQPVRNARGVWTGARLLVIGGGQEGVGLSLEGGGTRWRRLASWLERRDPALLWTGEELLVWGGTAGGAPTSALSAWRPDP